MVCENYMDGWIQKLVTCMVLYEWSTVGGETNAEKSIQYPRQQNENYEVGRTSSGSP